jgi:hypothetical protein
MLNEKDKEFVNQIDVSKFNKKDDQFWVLWSKRRNYVLQNYTEGKVNKIDEILKSCQVKLGKEEIAKRRVNNEKK